MERRLMKSRAVKEDDKKVKREQLIRAAIALFNKSPFEKISMDQIAKKAGVAKGTLYLYFKTKEELFLEIHRMDYEFWFESFQTYLKSKSPGLAPAELASWITESLRENQRMVRLMAIGSALLEKNVVYESAFRLKDAVRRHVLESSSDLSRVLKLKKPEIAIEFLTYLHALIVGLWHHAEPSPIVSKVLSSSDDFEIFRIDFFRILETAILTLLNGLSKDR
ncbi:TetR family transcriptional regulator [Leptospira ellisii]|nr:TetR family transcriptional regulator [Leptospira ellisii]MDV6235811.1 TetR family transcriptional regulator [Leptospira ellisii]